MANRNSKVLNSSKTIRTVRLSLVLELALLASGVKADTGQTIEGVYLKATVRTPVQMSAFYEARGFPPGATALLSKYCFITVIVRNHSDRVVWLEPARWTAKTGDGRVDSPLTPEEWSRQWDRAGLAAAQRATFQWTQLPKSRDLQPNEPVGGNLTLRRFPGKFTLNMVFATGEAREGEPIRAEIPGLSCDVGPGPSKPIK